VLILLFEKLQECVVHHFACDVVHCDDKVPHVVDTFPYGEKVKRHIITVAKLHDVATVRADGDILDFECLCQVFSHFVASG
jgi:hypothetical protein